MTEIIIIRDEHEKQEQHRDVYYNKLSYNFLFIIFAGERAHAYTYYYRRKCVSGLFVGDKPNGPNVVESRHKLRVSALDTARGGGLTWEYYGREGEDR